MSYSKVIASHQPRSQDSLLAEVPMALASPVAQ